jgi:uncharacterized protein
MNVGTGGCYMRNAELISVLNQYKVSHQAKYGIKRLDLFGSTARGTATGQSDIDIVVELEKQDLEEQLGSKVDIVSYRPTMNPFLKRRIDKEAVYAEPGIGDRNSATNQRGGENDSCTFSTHQPA